MNVKATTAGFVMAGLVSAGALTVLVVSQPAPVKQVQFVAPVDSTPTATVEPTVYCPDWTHSWRNIHRHSQRLNRLPLVVCVHQQRR